MRNPIERREVGVSNPFDYLKSEEEENKLDLDEQGRPKFPIEDEEEEQQLEEEEEQLEEEEEEGDGEEYDEEEEEEEEEQEVQIKTNVTKLLADRLKKDGQLPEDFEVTEDMSGKDVEEAYRRFMHEKLQQEAESAAMAKIRADYGDESVLEAAKKLKYGVSEEEVALVDIYAGLSQVEIDESHEEYESIVKAFFTQYYIDKSLTPEEAKENAQRDFEFGNIPDLLTARKTYFNNKAVELDRQQRQIVEDNKRAEREREENTIKRINTMLDSGVIDGVTYSPQEIETIRRALFEKTEVIEIDGKRVRVTAYNKKKYDRSKDDEKNLKDIADFILGYNLKSLSLKERKAARKQIVDDLNDSITVTVQTKKKKLGNKSTSDSDIRRRALN